MSNLGYLSKFVDKVPLKKGGLLNAALHETAGAAVYSGASFGFGYVQNRYREKASLGGVPADLLAGGLLTGAAFVGDWFNKGKGFTPLARAIGHAGLGSFFHTLGAGLGAEKSGVKRLLISEADVAKAKAALPNATILGVSEKAPTGDFLSATELAAMAR